jgi:hypothetical protein
MQFGLLALLLSFSLHAFATFGMQLLCFIAELHTEGSKARSKTPCCAGEQKLRLAKQGCCAGKQLLCFFSFLFSI